MVHHPSETTIYKWLFLVPGNYSVIIEQVEKHIEVLIIYVFFIVVLWILVYIWVHCFHVHPPGFWVIFSLSAFWCLFGGSGSETSTTYDHFCRYSSWALVKHWKTRVGWRLSKLLPKSMGPMNRLRSPTVKRGGFLASPRNLRYCKILEPKWPLFWLKRALFWRVDLQK